MSTQSDTPLGGFIEGEIAWSIARRRESFTVPELINGTALRHKVVAFHVRKWASAGWIAAIATSSSRGNPIRYVITASAPKVLPTRFNKSVQQRIWKALRASTRFTLRDVAYAADASEQTVKTYVRHLRLAGYVTVQRPHHSAAARPRQAVYAVMRWTGPWAPLIRSYRDGRSVVFDRNTATVVQQTCQQEEAA